MIEPDHRNFEQTLRNRIQVPCAGIIPQQFRISVVRLGKLLLLEGRLAPHEQGVLADVAVLELLPFGKLLERDFRLLELPRFVQLVRRVIFVGPDQRLRQIGVLVVLLAAEHVPQSPFARSLDRVDVRQLVVQQRPPLPRQRTARSTSRQPADHQRHALTGDRRSRMASPAEHGSPSGGVKRRVSTPCRDSGCVLYLAVCAKVNGGFPDRARDNRPGPVFRPEIGTSCRQAYSGPGLSGQLHGIREIMAQEPGPGRRGTIDRYQGTSIMSTIRRARRSMAS